MFAIDRNPSSLHLRVFGGGLWVGLWAWAFMSSDPRFAIPMAAAGMLFGLVALIRPSGLRLFYVGWMTVFFPLGWLMSHVVLATIFFGVFLPVGLVRRTFSQSPVRTSPDPDKSSYWEARQVKRERSSYFRQF
jgi:hypothetical protein